MFKELRREELLRVAQSKEDPLTSEINIEWNSDTCETCDEFQRMKFEYEEQQHQQHRQRPILTKFEIIRKSGHWAVKVSALVFASGTQTPTQHVGWVRDWLQKRRVRIGSKSCNFFEKMVNT